MLVYGQLCTMKKLFELERNTGSQVIAQNRLHTRRTTMKSKKAKQARDRWGNFIYLSSSKKGEPVKTTVIPYRSPRNSLQWLIAVVNTLEENPAYFNVIASTEEEAAGLGHKAFLQFLIDRPFFKELWKLMPRESNANLSCAPAYS